MSRLNESLQKVEKLQKLSDELSGVDAKHQDEVKEIGSKIDELMVKASEDLKAWDRVQLARFANRPTSIDYIDKLFTHFTEFHGDRLYGDDAAIIGGIGMLDDTPITIIAQQKGTTTEDKIKRNFGMAHPEGYRKALRLMKQAQKFKRPVICFVDTPGAYPGLGAEERGQGEAIAQNLMQLSQLTVPIITVIIGEGGSGGALAIAIADKVYMLENSIYSILSPEGFASILWKDSKKAPEAATQMKITAQELKQERFIDRIITEPAGGAHRDVDFVVRNLRRALLRDLDSLCRKKENALLKARYDKYRVIGAFTQWKSDADLYEVDEAIVPSEIVATE